MSNKKPTKKTEVVGTSSLSEDIESDVSSISKNVEVVYPHTNKILEEVVELEPYQLGNNFRTFLLINLRKKVENKCNTLGYIESVDEIKDYDNGLIITGNFSGNISYNVKYKAKIYIPVPNTNIICKFKMIKHGRCFCMNGPLFIIIKTTNISDKFTFDAKGNLMYGERIITDNDYLQVCVLKKMFNMNAQIIVVFARLDDIATESQLNYYSYSNNNEEKIENYIINMS